MSTAVDAPYFQSEFSAAEFRRRRETVAVKIGDAVAILQGLPETGAFSLFRQHNDFLYLSGVEVPHAYLSIDGRNGRTTLYLLPQDEASAKSEGAELNADDAQTVCELTGVDEVRSTCSLLDELPLERVVYLCQAPPEGRQACQDTLRHARKRAAADPACRENHDNAHFGNLLRQRRPSLEIRDLSPILAELRLIKSEAELSVMRRAGRLTAQAVDQAMRCTAPGVYEYELAAVADYVYLASGASGGGYRPIIAGGSNIWNMHYFRNNCPLIDGELVLMDYAPDLAGYASDIGRMWPVGGRYNREQRDLYGFVVDFHAALLETLGPGLTAVEATRRAAEKMRPRASRVEWSKPTHAAAIERLLAEGKPCTHPVGMAVHDVGAYYDRPLEPGVVFALDPQLWVPEERLYIRVEDCVAITSHGVESLTSEAPLDLDEVERIVGTGGILQSLPPLMRPIAGTA